MDASISPDRSHPQAGESPSQTEGSNKAFQFGHRIGSAIRGFVLQALASKTDAVAQEVLRGEKGFEDVELPPVSSE